MEVGHISQAYGLVVGAELRGGRYLQGIGAGLMSRA